MENIDKWLATLWLFTVMAKALAFTVNDEIQLKKLLLQNEGVSTVRPNHVTLIGLSFNLVAINKVDIKNEQFGVSGWWSMEWKDSRLNWSNSKYTGIPVVQVTSSDIWTPALVVDNSVEDLKAIDESTIPLRLRQDGQVTWNPPGILLTSCDMVVTYFPFDIQTCSVQVTSFGYTIQELNISVRASGISRTHYQTNGEWLILKTWNERKEFEEDGYSYAKVSYFIQLQRRGAFYGMNTLLPVLLNSLLIPLVFLLPHDSGEKIGYCLTVLLAYVVLLTIVTQGLPTTAKNQSLLGVYISVVLSMSGISVFQAIHSLHIYHRCDKRPIPQWQVKLTRFIQWILRRERSTKQKPHAVSPVQVGVTEKKNHLDRLNLKRKSSLFGRINSHDISSDVRADVSSLTSDGECAQEEMSWQLVATIYDAFLLRLYFAIIFFVSVGFLLALASNQF